MSVSSTTTKNSYSGNGSTTAFAYGFKIFADADLQVIIRASTGVETVKTLTTHYTVSNAGNDSGGNVTFTSGNTPASGQTVVIRRNLALTQSTDYVENDPFPAESHEDGLDRLTFIAQGIQEELDRSFKVSKTNSITTPEFVDDASTRASKLLGFSSDGNNLEATTGRVSSVTTSNVAVNGSGSSQAATVSFNSISGALALGIPVGSTGATGATGDVEDTLTTRGDLLKRGASATERLAIGSANTVLTTNGTDPAWSTITNAMLAGSIDLTSKVTGALPIANGGTAATSASAARTALELAVNSWSGILLLPANQTYKLVIKIPFAGVINSVTTMCASGSATATFKINTTALGGTANAISTSEQSQNHASDNAFSVGDDIQVTISSNSSCVDASFSIVYTR